MAAPILWLVVDEEALKPRFAYTLRRARERRGLTPPQLAVAIGVTRGTVNNWERPDLKDAPSILLLGRLCAALAVDPRVFAVLPHEPPSDVDAYLVGEAVAAGARTGRRRAARKAAEPAGPDKPVPSKRRPRAVDTAGSEPPDGSGQETRT